MFDESTSAVDDQTESIIYQLLKQLGIWFVTISHRPSLIKFHQIELKLFSNIRDSELNILHIDEQDKSILNIDRSLPEEEGEIRSISINKNVQNKSSENWFKQIKDLWNLIHLPFQPNDSKLRIQVKLISNQYEREYLFVDICFMVFMFDYSWRLFIYLVSFYRSNR